MIQRMFGRLEPAAILLFPVPVSKAPLAALTLCRNVRLDMRSDDFPDPLCLLCVMFPVPISFKALNESLTTEAHRVFHGTKLQFTLAAYQEIMVLPNIKKVV